MNNNILKKKGVKNMKTKEVTNMLMDSAKIVHNLIKNPNKQDIETTKIQIAGANTLAQTVKTMIQAEIVSLKLDKAQLNTNLLVHQIIEEN